MSFFLYLQWNIIDFYVTDFMNSETKQKKCWNSKGVVPFTFTVLDLMRSIWEWNFKNIEPINLHCF